MCKVYRCPIQDSLLFISLLIMLITTRASNIFGGLENIKIVLILDCIIRERAILYGHMQILTYFWSHD